MANNRLIKAEAEARRAKVKELYIRGYKIPEIMKQLPEYYGHLKEAYLVCRKDVFIVKERLEEETWTNNEALAVYIAQQEEIYRQAIEFPFKSENAKVGALRVAIDASKNIAMAKGVDVNGIIRLRVDKENLSEFSDEELDKMISAFFAGYETRAQTD